jgi:hypothetical protein
LDIRGKYLGPFSLPLKVLLYSTFPITLHEI